MRNDYLAKPFNADFWLDDAGRVRRVRVDYHTARGSRVVVDGRFSNFGTKVDLTRAAGRGRPGHHAVEGERMVEQAKLEDVGSGIAPVSDGWFVVNAGEAAWVRNDAFGGRCTFESSPRVLAERPDVEPRMFQEVGYTLGVLEPGKPSGLYHAESLQEDFLVLSGECLLVIEGEERRLRAWDFVHCPAGTEHIFVGAGDGAVHHLHDRRTPRGPDAPVSALRRGSRAWRERGDRDDLAARGVQSAPELAARAARRVGRPSLVARARERAFRHAPVTLPRPRCQTPLFPVLGSTSA